MAIKTIPVNFDSPDFTLLIDLDGTVYSFRFTFNSRTSRYSMSIFTEEGDPLVTGIALTTNWKPLERFKDERLPKGQLFTADMTGGNSEPSDVNFGDTVLLCYNEATV